MEKAKNKSKIFCRLMRNIKERKSLFILLFILQMLGLPVITIAIQILRTHTEYSSYSFSVFLFVPCLFFSAASISGILCSILSFSYLHSKSRSDSELSLPMSATQRFIGDFLSGLIVYVVPYITAVVTSLLVILCFKKTSYNPVISDNVNIVNTLMRGILRFINSNISEIIYMAFCGLLIMIMLYTFTSFITVCCGNIIECVSYTIISNVFIPLSAYTCTSTFPTHISSINYGFNINIDSQSVNIVSVTSPLGGLAMMINRLKSLYNTEELIPAPSYWVLKYIIVILVIFLISFLLYKKRNAEDISKPFVFSFAYYLFAAPVIMSAFGYFFRINLTITSVILSLILFAAMDLIRCRGLQKKKLIKSAAFYTASVALSFLMIEASEAYRLNDIKKIPDPSDVRSVTLNLPIKNNYNNYHPVITFTDTENIKTAIDMNRDSIENGENNYTLSLQIMYTKKNGKKIYREIPISEYDYFEQAKKFLHNEKTPDVLAKTISAAFDRYDKTMSLFNGYDVPTEKLMINNIQIDEISDSLKKDIRTAAENNTVLTVPFCIINSCYYIPVEFTNTIDTFKKFGFV